MIQINAGELPGLLGGQLKAHCTEPGKRRAADLWGERMPTEQGERSVSMAEGSRVAAKTLQPGICGSSALQKRNTHSG